MICPKCGDEIPEGNLYCKECGYEVNIVPEFEPDVYENLNQTLKGIASDVEGKEEPIEYKKPKKRMKVLLFLAVFIGIVLIAGVTIFIVSLNNHQNFEYQYQKAIEAEKQGNLDKAIQYIEKALTYDDSRTDAMMLRADYYMESGKCNDAVILYMELIQYHQKTDQNTGTNTTMERNAIEKVADYYISEQDYEKVNTFLLEYGSENIKQKYQQYLAEKPEFTLPEGTYDRFFKLAFVEKKYGVIRYTLDGSIPDQNSDIYTEPVLLNLGNYIVNAVYENEFGITSEVAVCEYLIDVISPEEPVIMLTNSEYTSPEYIAIQNQEGCTVYYTTDGSLPTPQNGMLYTGVIPMKMGECTYTFVSFNARQISSDPVSITTNLQFPYVVSVEDSVNSLVRRLIELGIREEDALYSQDEEEQTGKYEYVCENAFSYENMILYLVEEYFYTDSLQKNKTGKKYAIDSGSGYLYNVTETNGGILEAYRLN